MNFKGDLNLCYGYGDPHYVQFVNIQIIFFVDIYDLNLKKTLIKLKGGKKLDITDDCSYVLATNNCFSSNRSNSNNNYTYEVVVNHEKGMYESSNMVFIKSVDVLINGTIFSIEKNFTVDSEIQTLPYTSHHKKCRAYQKFKYIVLECEWFKLEFDGVQYMKFQDCAERVCGLCGSKDESDKFNISNWSRC